ncbi:MAG: hypothetical protein SWY16_01190 [Cyanobacteriota bacterium]|nr:hypothetical protein [Cyanobacteriota bacterium]
MECFSDRYRAVELNSSIVIGFGLKKIEHPRRDRTIESLLVSML